MYHYSCAPEIATSQAECIGGIFSDFVKVSGVGLSVMNVCLL